MLRTVSRSLTAALRRLSLAAAILIAGSAATSPAFAADDCRVAYDMGSSGIRGGAADGAATVQLDLDTLAALWAGTPPAALAAKTVPALRQLQRQGGFDRACAQLGGGFSAWRLALDEDRRGLVRALARIHRATGVAVVVVPPLQEGAYGYAAARQVLGARLTTPYILDIGGGSLQIAGTDAAYGIPLGQKAWQRLLCRELRHSDAVPCALQPLDAADLARARVVLAAELRDLERTLPGTSEMTAISRPVSRGIAPALRRLAAEERRDEQRQERHADGRLELAEVSAAIAALAPLDLETTMQRTGAHAPHAAFLVSDLLLLEGLLQRTGGADLAVAEAELSNLPGLLADDRAFAWTGRYACYLQRLQRNGLTAFASDPATCPH